ncbi:SMI1/KNR4 family protein [Roseibium aggregatum]|uniref:DUF1851 domain-containing protein n=1 Tax=Roseibium aggregatum TaxID=187304 RepID=A0A926P5W7_9HYPH|nr:SMI1/KNR4 family protein [Roseibium aggregatum]MBD1548711.1 DUF1851 domain-containing protein [Roseibium aggregatum]
MSVLQIDELKQIPGVKFEEPNSKLAENDGVLSSGFTLPKAHMDLLAISNGMSICDGYYKLFGLYNEKNKNLEIWNEREYWKFAWEGRVDNFLCFATTVWGDQYAYRISSVEQGEATPIFFLHAFSMEADLIANSFEEFWQKNFIRKAKDPNDEMVTKCRASIGPLGWDEFLVYNPPLELGGTEDVSSLSKMQPRPAMIINADLAMGMEKLSDDTVIEGVDTYVDSLGRMSIRYVTSDASPKKFPFKFW